MVYNYRFDRNLRDEIFQRLRQEHVLSQGWGGGNEANLDVRNPDFVTQCTRFYKLATTRVPTNLTRMSNLKRGDLLVVPHLPGHDKVSIHVVADDFPTCYQYVPGDENHQNHRIKIERSYGLDGEVSIYNVRLARWYGKLQWLRLPLLPIPQFEADFRNIIGQLEQTPGHSLEASKLSDYIKDMGCRVMDQLKKELRGISANNGPISFEAICERLVNSNGYRVVRRHQYDSAGGDVDLECVRERSDVSPFESGEILLFVQVKKHTGTTDELAINQLLKMIEQKPEADGCVMSLGDAFSETARKLAENNGILLMPGETVCRLLLEEITGGHDA
jgi:hypothetical protein